MDPALWELYESGSENDEVSVMMRLADQSKVPEGARVISRFGEVVTARIRRGDIRRVWESDEVVSVKAPRALSWPGHIDESEDADSDADAGSAIIDGRPVPLPIPEDGTGVIIGICDWGFDFTHANLRRPDGTTRLLALWDQSGTGGPAAPHFGYGRLHGPEAINAALKSPDPFSALGYHPSRSDPTGTGSHGTHVADILAGNRREPGSEVGLASGADLIFVHLGADHLSWPSNFGDSVRLIEGIDFIRRNAGTRPCVIHLSAGKTGGAHRGETPFERGMDAMLTGRPNISLTQSCGNYADAAMHTHARIGPDQSYVLLWIVNPRDRTPNQLEIWYAGEDVFDITLVAPNGAEIAVPLDARSRVEHAGVRWGNLYHRRHEPNSGLNHIDIFLNTSAPTGRWRVALRGREVVDGRFHAWIERDAAGYNQSRFERHQATALYTTNTICNGLHTIAVGAYDGTRLERPPTHFSSRGPTADGRQKPEIVAPGYRIRAARSTPAGGWSGEPRLTVKSGTSMAAPWVSGTVALMFQAAGRPLTINEVRSLLIGTADPHAGPPGRSSTRLGYGYLNIAAAVEAARRIGAEPVKEIGASLHTILPLREGPVFPAPDDSIVPSAENSSPSPSPCTSTSPSTSTSTSMIGTFEDDSEGELHDGEGEPEWEEDESIPLEDVYEALVALEGFDS